MTPYLSISFSSYLRVGCVLKGGGVRDYSSIYCGCYGEGTRASDG